MKEVLRLPAGVDGNVWAYAIAGVRHRPHRHDELEVNLVTRGSAVYLMGERRYEMRPGTQLWLFPEQDHVLLEQSPDFRMWIAVFTPRLVRRAATDERSRTLQGADPGEVFCKSLAPAAAARVAALFEDVAAARDDRARFNAGLAYAMLAAWHAQSSSAAD